MVLKRNVPPAGVIKRASQTLAVSISIAKSRHGIGLRHWKQRPRSIRKPRMGVFSHQESR